MATRNDARYALGEMKKDWKAFTQDMRQMVKDFNKATGILEEGLKNFVKVGEELEDDDIFNESKLAQSCENWQMFVAEK
jgi:hypothetical protein